MQVDYLGWSLDFSTLMMLITLKTVGVAFNYADGDRKEPKNAKEEVVKTWQMHQRYATASIPTPLEYFGFLFFYPPVISAPIYEYRDYIKWAETKNLPSAPRRVLERVAFAILNLVVYLLVVPYFPRDNLVEPTLSSMTFGEKLFYSWGATFFCRPKYYIAWFLAEGACITAGFGYNEHKKEWSDIKQASYINVEFGTTIRQMVNHWNIGVSRWLRNYVYTRVPKQFQLLATFTTSALWHGLYSGYFLMFVAFAFGTEIHRALHKKLRPLVFRNSPNIEDLSNENVAKKLVYHIFAFLLTQLHFAYFAASFHILDLAGCIHWYQNMYWAGHVILVVLYVFVVYIMPTPRAKKEETKKQ
jgi:D-alanyl-lipoteichoic acid acyltransferase DltB (MBOAT superfamily)